MLSKRYKQPSNRTVERPYEKMRVSGVSSLSRKESEGKATPLKAVWQLCRVADCAEVRSGGTPTTDNPRFWNGDIPWVTPSEISNAGKYLETTASTISKAGLDKSSAELLPANTVIMCSRATIGPRVILKVPMATNQGFKNFICKANLDPEFWYYYLDVVLPAFLSCASGNTFKEVSKADIEKTIIRLPPLSEQHRIVAILSTCDWVIELKWKLLEEKKAQKRALLQLLLEPKGGNSSFSLVGIGGRRSEKRIPNRVWTWKRLGDIGRISTGKTPDTTIPGYFGGNTPFITPGDFSETPYITKTERTLTTGGTRETRVFPPGSIYTVCIGATVGKVGVCPVSATCNQQVNVLEVLPRFDALFCYYAVLHHFNKGKRRLIGAETLPLVNKTDFSQFSIPMPPLIEQRRIANVLFAADREIDGLVREVEAWKEKKKALSQLLLSGKVRV